MIFAFDSWIFPDLGVESRIFPDLEGEVVDFIGISWNAGASLDFPGNPCVSSYSLTRSLFVVISIAIAGESRIFLDLEVQSPWISLEFLEISGLFHGIS